jgi:CRISPR-associated endoribonuclease Cas6
VSGISPPDSDLCSVVLRTAPERGVAPTNGRHLHAAFLRWIADIDQALAADLHAPGRTRPFTVALLPPSGQEAGLALRCSLLDRRLIAAVQERLAGGAIRLRLGSSVYEFQPAPSDIWSGAARWQDLVDASGTDRDIRLEFATPTCFSRNLPGQRTHLAMFPQPELLWESWARKWRTFGPPHPGLSSAADAAARRVIVSAYQLATRTVDLGRFPQKGFLGWVDYELQPDTPPEVARVLNMLTDFAAFAGSGYKTTMGLGLTRRRM